MPPRDAQSTILDAFGVEPLGVIDTIRVKARFAAAVPPGRSPVNVPATPGLCGAVTGLTPSLPPGSFGGSSTADNVGSASRQNIKRVAHPPS